MSYQCSPHQGLFYYGLRLSGILLQDFPTDTRWLSVMSAGGLFVAASMLPVGLYGALVYCRRLSWLCPSGVSVFSSVVMVTGRVE